METSENTVLIPNKNIEYKVYTKRWLILFLYAITSFISYVQASEYVSIADTMTKYYDVSITAVNWTSNIGLIELVVITFPSISIIEKLGLRKTMLICVCGTSIATWIKVGGVAPTRFWAILLGQGINAIFNFLLGSLPAKVAKQWFGGHEVSMACAIGILTCPIGQAMAFLIPTSIVHSTDLKSVASELYIVNISYAIVSTVLIPFIFFFFNDNPPTPPSNTADKIENQNLLRGLCISIKNCLSNWSFILSIIIISINAAFLVTVITILNPELMKYYPNSIAGVGYVGCAMNAAGGFGLLLNGYLLDTFKQYKLMVWITVPLSLASFIVFKLFLDKGLHVVYIFASLYGFTYYGLMMVLIEIGIEFTYPEPEITVCCIYNILSQPLGVAFTYLYTNLIVNHSELTVSLIFISILIFVDILLIFIKYDLKRQNNFRSSID